MIENLAAEMASWNVSLDAIISSTSRPKVSWFRLDEDHGAADFLGICVVRSHVGESLSLRFDTAEILVHPHDDVALLGASAPVR